MPVQDVRDHFREMYFYNIASTVHVAAASTLMWDMFNADASLIVRVQLICHIVNLETAVTGVGFEWQLLRTTTVGTGGTGQTAWLADTLDTALDADITCRLKPTGGASSSTSLSLCPPASWKGIVLRQNQGLRLNQETNSNAGNSAWLIGFTVE